MKREELEAAAAKWVRKEWLVPPDGGSGCPEECFLAGAEYAHAQGYREGLERAAEFAEFTAESMKRHGLDVEAKQSSYLAFSFRNLIPEAPK